MKKSDRKRLVLLDSHAIIHRAYHALPEFVSSSGEPTGALYGLSTMLVKTIADLKPDYIIACYDLPQKTFRHEAYSAYKAGRAKADDALIAQLKSSRRIFEAFNIPMYELPGFEADDMLGTIVHKVLHEKKHEDIDIVIVSGDMDTLQLVSGDRVQVFTLKKGINDTILYNEEKVIERFGFSPKLLPDYKGLRGDPSDNIIGIKGIGEKTATTLITEFGTIEEIYKKVKSKKEKVKSIAGITDRIIGLIEEGEDEAVFSKTLATIRLDAPIEFSLPKLFVELFDSGKIEKLFTDLEFRSLVPKVKNILSSGTQEPEEVVVQEVVDEQELLETSIALWVIDSDSTNGTLDDIYTFAKTKKFADAKKIIFTALKNKKLEEVFTEIEKPIMIPIREMEEAGILIDQEFFKELSQTYHIELDRLSGEIYTIAGGEFNINSPKQLSEILFEKLGLASKGKRGAAGNFSTKAEVLEELSDVHPIISKILEQRELQKLLSTYIDVIPQMVGEDGRLHAKFLQHGTTTGRFSSQNPNLQNIPIKSELGRAIRKGFIAGPGKKLVAFDYSQIELRAVAILSQDKHLTEIFKNGKDVHAGVASFVFGVPEDKVDAEMRRRAKIINFGIIYGMGVSALKKNLGSTREEAQNFYNAYFEQMSGVREYLDGVKSFAIEHGYTETLFGRVRSFPNIRSKIPFIKNIAERMATNAPIQGTAADIIKLALRFVNEDLKSSNISSQVQLVLQIHDELVFEIEESVVGEAEKIIRKAMSEVLSRSWKKIQTDIPLVSSFGFGNNLGEVK
jgi:DNA polymerase-1